MAKPGRKQNPMGIRMEGLKPEWVKLAGERTEFLLHHVHLRAMPLQTILANAWLQGAMDAAETMKNRWPDRIPAPDIAPTPEGLA